MSSRIGIQQIVRTTQPVDAAVGDEWFNPSTGKLYKNIALGGTQVGFLEVPVLSQSVNITNATNATSTFTGALTVAGGAGVQGNLYVGGTIYGTISGSISNATNLTGGTAGQLPYQSAPGVTAFAGPGTAGQLLVSAGSSAPVYTNTASIYVGRAIQADGLGNTSTQQVGYAANLLGGTAGQIAYQSAGNTTLFTGPGTYGQFLMSTGASAPVYQSTLTQVNGNIIINSTASSTSTTTGALQVVGGAGIGGSLYVGNTATISTLGWSSADYTQPALRLDVPTGTLNNQLAFTYAGAPTAGISADSNGYMFIDNTTGNFYWNLRLGTSSLISFINRGQRFITFNNSVTPANAGIINIGAQNTTATNTAGSPNGSLVVQGGIAATNNIVIQSTASSASTNTGALQVAGGVGVAGGGYFGGIVTATLFVGTFTGSILGIATTATNIGGGTTGQVPYQSAPGTTLFYGPGTAGQLLVSGGTSAPAYTNTASIYVGAASNAVNLFGGTAGQLAYQSAGNTTLFTGPGTYGQFLMSTGASAPVYQSTLTQAGGNIVITSNSASTSTTTGALQVINGGVGIGGSVYVGNRVGFVNASNVSAVYQVYNSSANSLDTIFG
jgi:hypothetical protein